MGEAKRRKALDKTWGTHKPPAFSVRFLDEFEFDDFQREVLTKDAELRPALVEIKGVSVHACFSPYSYRHQGEMKMNCHLICDVSTVPPAFTKALQNQLLVNQVCRDATEQILGSTRLVVLQP